VSDLLHPDRLLTNARVQTMDGASGVAAAVAVKDGRIVAVGSDGELRGLAGRRTIVEDLDGATVIPGLIDPHNHLLATGIMLGQLQL